VCARAGSDGFHVEVKVGLGVVEACGVEGAVDDGLGGGAGVGGVEEGRWGELREGCGGHGVVVVLIMMMMMKSGEAGFGC